MGVDRATLPIHCGWAAKGERGYRCNVMVQSRMLDTGNIAVRMGCRHVYIISIERCEQRGTTLGACKARRQAGRQAGCQCIS